MNAIETIKLSKEDAQFLSKAESIGHYPLIYCFSVNGRLSLVKTDYFRLMAVSVIAGDYAAEENMAYALIDKRRLAPVGDALGACSKLRESVDRWLSQAVVSVEVDNGVLDVSLAEHPNGGRVMWRLNGNGRLVSDGEKTHAQNYDTLRIKNEYYLENVRIGETATGAPWYMADGEQRQQMFAMPMAL